MCSNLKLAVLYSGAVMVLGRGGDWYVLNLSVSIVVEKNGIDYDSDKVDPLGS